MSDPTATVSTKTTTEHPASTRRGAVCSPRFHARHLDGGAQDPGAGGLEDGVEGGGEVRSAVTDQELNVLEPLAEAESEAAGLLHGPLARRARGDATDVHPAGAMLDEHQHVYALQQHGVHVQEIDRDNPSGLG